MRDLNPQPWAFVETLNLRRACALNHDADALARLRELYDRLRRGPLVIHGILEYEVCVCRRGKGSFEKQKPIPDKETVLDGSDMMEVQRVRHLVLSNMIMTMYSRINELFPKD